MNEIERKELLERIADELGFTLECHYEKPDCWGYIDIDDIDEWKRIVIKENRVHVGSQIYFYTETGWKRKLKQQIKIILRNIKERKIKEMENRKKAIQNCGATYEC